MPHQIALNKAKIALMSHPNSTFFTTVCFSLKHLWDESVPTACTNGLSIEFNPTYFMSLTVEERVFLLLHETMHAAFLHMVRRGSREHQRFNIAADHANNLILIERGFLMPKGGYADPQYSGMSAEQIYDLLPQDSKMNQPMDLKEPDSPPDIMEETMKEILVRAAVQSKMNGDDASSIPASIQIYLDKLLTPKLPWNRILQKYMNSTAKNDYSFRKPNRRFFPRHHLPSLYSIKLMDLVIAVDTSGSVSNADFAAFITEVASILKTMQPDKITLLQFDTELKSVETVSSVRDLLKLKFTGRGGTKIKPVIEWADEKQPQLMMVFTDGHFQKIPLDGKYDLLWLIHKNPNFTAPRGKVIHYENI